jgi:hypothetical protein
MSAHPDHAPARVVQSIVQLDSVVSQISLTTLDLNAPTVSRFAQRSVPVVILDPNTASAPGPQCACIPPEVGQPNPYQNWSYPLPFDTSLSPTQLRDEECRRVCWCALSVVATHAAQCAAFGQAPPTLWLSDPSNVCAPAHLLSFWSPDPICA